MLFISTNTANYSDSCRFSFELYSLSEPKDHKLLLDALVYGILIDPTDSKNSNLQAVAKILKDQKTSLRYLPFISDLLVSFENKELVTLSEYLQKYKDILIQATPFNNDFAERNQKALLRKIAIHVNKLTLEFYCNRKQLYKNYIFRTVKISTNANRGNIIFLRRQNCSFAV